MGTPHAVAISYAGPDVDYAAALYRRLVDWLDEKDVYFHARNGTVNDPLTDIYNSCSLMAVLITKTYADRRVPLRSILEFDPISDEKGAESGHEVLSFVRRVLDDVADRGEFASGGDADDGEPTGGA